MKINPLQKNIQGAYIASDYLGWLFTQIGNSNHPRGVIPVAYRNSLRSLKTALTERNPVRSAGEVMASLNREVVSGVRPILENAVIYGSSYADRQLENLNITGNNRSEQDWGGLFAALNALDAVINKQKSEIMLLMMTGADQSRIIGDNSRVGALRPGDVISHATEYAASLLWDSFHKRIKTKARSQADRIKKVAVAAVDSRTTDCCLRVNGQVRGVDEPFHLSGSPRFSDEMDWSPFHHYCRTSVALHYPEYDDGITTDLQDQSKKELERREKSNTSKPQKIYSSSRIKPKVNKVFTPFELIDKWVNGSWYKIPTHMKFALKEEFGLDASVYMRYPKPIDSKLVNSMRPTIRAIYNSTQEYFKAQGIETVKVYRGIKTDTPILSVAESWTDNYSIANRFDGFGVMEMEVPVSRIFISYQCPDWHNGKYGQQLEYIILAED